MQIPSEFLAALPEASRYVAEEWWLTLSETDRQRIAELWDARLDVSFFSPQRDADGCVDDWRQVPTVRGGRFVPSDDDGRGEWTPGYFEHLLQHPELVLAYNPPSRTFHIGCTLHGAARACISAGFVPLDFECPVNSLSCPLLVLRGARLSAATRTEPTDEPNNSMFKLNSTLG